MPHVWVTGYVIIQKQLTDSGTNVRHFVSHPTHVICLRYFVNCRHNKNVVILSKYWHFAFSSCNILGVCLKWLQHISHFSDLWSSEYFVCSWLSCGCFGESENRNEFASSPVMLKFMLSITVTPTFRGLVCIPSVSSQILATVQAKGSISIHILI